MIFFHTKKGTSDMRYACGCSWVANEKGLVLMMSGYAPCFCRRAQKDGDGNKGLSEQGFLRLHSWICSDRSVGKDNVDLLAIREDRMHFSPLSVLV